MAELTRGGYAYAAEAIRRDCHERCVQRDNCICEERAAAFDAEAERLRERPAEGNGPTADALQSSGTVDLLEEGVGLLKARYGADLMPAPESVRRYVAVAEQVVRDWRRAWEPERDAADAEG